MRSAWITRADGPLSARQATIIRWCIFGLALTGGFNGRSAQRINPHGSSPGRRARIISCASKHDECQALITFGSFGLNWVLRCSLPGGIPENLCQLCQSVQTMFAGTSFAD
jgi:hypothetical protein